MNLAARLLLPILAATALAAPAQAESYRIPKDTVPAIEVNKADGWAQNYDDFGNLTFFAADKSGGMLFRMIEAGATEAMPSSEAVAQLILSSAGAQPYSRTEKTSFAGGPADAYYSTMGEGGAVELKVVIRQIDAKRLAVGVTLIPKATGPAGRAAIEAQFATAHIATR